MGILDNIENKAKERAESELKAKADEESSRLKSNELINENINQLEDSKKQIQSTRNSISTFYKEVLPRNQKDLTENRDNVKDAIKNAYKNQDIDINDEELTNEHKNALLGIHKETAEDITREDDTIKEYWMTHKAFINDVKKVREEKEQLIKNLKEISEEFPEDIKNEIESLNSNSFNPNNVEGEETIRKVTEFIDAKIDDLKMQTIEWKEEQKNELIDKISGKMNLRANKLEYRESDIDEIRELAQKINIDENNLIDEIFDNAIQKNSEKFLNREYSLEEYKNLEEDLEFLNEYTGKIEYAIGKLKAAENDFKSHVTKKFNDILKSNEAIRKNTGYLLSGTFKHSDYSDFDDDPNYQLALIWRDNYLKKITGDFSDKTPSEYMANKISRFNPNKGSISDYDIENYLKTGLIPHNEIDKITDQITKLKEHFSNDDNIKNITDQIEQNEYDALKNPLPENSLTCEKTNEKKYKLESETLQKIRGEFIGKILRETGEKINNLEKISKEKSNIIKAKIDQTKSLSTFENPQNIEIRYRETKSEINRIKLDRVDAEHLINKIHIFEFDENLKKFTLNINEGVYSTTYYSEIIDPENEKNLEIYKEEKKDADKAINELKKSAQFLEKKLDNEISHILEKHNFDKQTLEFFEDEKNLESLKKDIGIHMPKTKKILQDEIERKFNLRKQELIQDKSERNIRKSPYLNAKQNLQSFIDSLNGNQYKILLKIIQEQELSGKDLDINSFRQIIKSECNKILQISVRDLESKIKKYDDLSQEIENYNDNIRRLENKIRLSN